MPVWGLWILLVVAAAGIAVPSLVLGYAAWTGRHRQGGESVAVFPAVGPLLFLVPVWVVLGLLSGLGLAAWGHGATGTAGWSAVTVFALFAVIAGGWLLAGWVKGTRRAARLNRQQVPYPD